MKHLLNNMSEEEKNSIREQHTDRLKVVTENFSKLTNSKLGNSKPIVSEQSSPQGNQYTMSMDIIVSNDDKKVKIPKGTKFNWNPSKKIASAPLPSGGIITYNPYENGESPENSCAIDFRINNEIYDWKWSDCIFGIVYKPDYKAEAEKFYSFFDR